MYLSDAKVVRTMKVKNEELMKFLNLDPGWTLKDVRLPYGHQAPLIVIVCEKPDQLAGEIIQDGPEETIALGAQPGVPDG